MTLFRRLRPLLPGAAAPLLALLLAVSVAGCSPDEEDPSDGALDEDFPSALDTTDTVSDGDTADTAAVGADTAAVGPDTDEPAGPPAGEGAPPPRDRPAQTTPPPDRTDAAPPAGEGGPETREGRVVVTGAVPTTFLTLQWEGGSVVLRGDLSDELRRLTGATVRVTGTPVEQGQQSRALRVVNYEILEIDGGRPTVGVLMREADGMHLHDESGRMLPLAGAPASMQRRVGAKVWIVGPVEDGALRVRSYGVIRPEG